MLSFNTVVERALTGPIFTEKDFDLGIFVPNLRKVIEKYGIKYDPQTRCHPMMTWLTVSGRQAWSFWSKPAFTVWTLKDVFYSCGKR